VLLLQVAAHICFTHAFIRGAYLDEKYLYEVILPRDAIASVPPSVYRSAAGWRARQNAVHAWYANARMP
jgi:hypothetical protein